MIIIFKYIIFAVIATLINLQCQYFSFSLYSGFASLYVAMSIGTLSGLIAKYLLDKKFIFYHVPRNKKDDMIKFFLYSLMGIITTIIFWFTEMLFYYLLPNPNAKYVGAAIGLSAGYLIKYFLDRKFVFIHKRVSAT